MTEEKAQIKNHGNIGFRYAKGKDAGLVLEFLKRLSEYEKAEEHLVSTPELLQEELERENGAVVDRFLAAHPEFAPEPFALPGPAGEAPEGRLTLWPHLHDTDGFFIAKLRRRL